MTAKKARRRKRDPWGEAAESVKAMFAETIPLLTAFALSVFVDQVVRRFAALAEPDWQHAAHGFLIITDVVTATTLIAPKALVLLNEVIGLLMNICETVALGVRRIWDALTRQEKK